jgi:hypothetical protein
MRRTLAALTILLPSAAAFAAVEGENKDKSLLAVRTAEPPVIDGRLDDHVWRDAPADDRFRQSFPDDGKTPSERTEVRVLYDDEAIYVGLRMHDREPDKIVARLTRRDRNVETDVVGVAIDSRHDHSSGFAFLVSAAGVQQDLLLFNDIEDSVDWDAVWDGEVSRDRGGWSAELRIPLSVLRFSDADEQVWGFTVRRYVSRTKEQSDWAHVPQGTAAFVSRMGHLVGLKGLKPRRALELRPFGVAQVRTRTSSGGAFLGLDRHASPYGEMDVGLDVKYGITSNLTVDATLNPDFGQVEADAVVLNLSRFESFFPEKRPFFLEGTDLFRTPVQVFYSRRIGRPPSGLTPGSVFLGPDGAYLEAVRTPLALPIWTAAKVTGKAGSRTTIGLLDALTAPEDVTALDAGGTQREVRRAPPRNYAALRAKYGFGGASYLGVMATAVNRLGGELARPSADHDAYVQSVDGLYRSGDGRWRVSGQALLSERVGGPSHVTTSGAACPDPAADPTCLPITRQDGTTMGPGAVGFGGQLGAGYQGETWGTAIFGETYSPRLDVNDLGFLNTFNNTFLRLEGSWRALKPSGIFQQRTAGWNVRSGMTYDRVRTAAGLGGWWWGQFRNFMSVNVDIGTSLPGNWEVFETGDGARFERVPGANMGLWFESDTRKRVSGYGGAWGWRDYYGPAAGGGFEAFANVHVLSQLELNVGGAIWWDHAVTRNWFYGGCVDGRGAACGQDTMSRTYRFGELDAGAVSLTMRGTYTFAPRLSLQGYAQLFMSQGYFANRTIARTVGDEPFIHREMLEADPDFTGDFDGDGRPDDSFQDTALNVNVVLRWEPLAGTTLLAVYTRSQQAAYILAGSQPHFRITGLSTGPTEDIVLIKLVYFWT